MNQLEKVWVAKAGSFRLGPSGAEFGEKGDLPDQFLYVFGVDFGATEALTIAFDILGQRVIDSPQLVQ